MATSEIHAITPKGIYFTLSNKRGIIFLIDHEDYYNLVHKKNYWYVHMSGRKKDMPYIRSYWSKENGHIHLHREVLGAKDWSHDSVVDHVNSNTTDLRKSELKLGTTRENNHSSAKPKIVYREIAITEVHRSNNRVYYQSYLSRKMIAFAKTVELAKEQIDKALTNRSLEDERSRVNTESVAYHRSADVHRSELRS